MSHWFQGRFIRELALEVRGRLKGSNVGFKRQMTCVASCLAKRQLEKNDRKLVAVKKWKMLVHLSKAFCAFSALPFGEKGLP